MTELKAHSSGRGSCCHVETCHSDRSPGDLKARGADAMQPSPSEAAPGSCHACAFQKVIMENLIAWSQREPALSLQLLLWERPVKAMRKEDSWLTQLDCPFKTLARTWQPTSNLLTSCKQEHGVARQWKDSSQDAASSNWHIARGLLELPLTTHVKGLLTHLHLQLSLPAVLHAWVPWAVL